MSEVRQMLGVEDLTGRTFGKIRVIGMARRNPLRWECRCVVCRTGYSLNSETARRGECLDSLCGRALERPTPSIAHTGTTAHAVRSRDSASAAAFAREYEQTPANGRNRN